MNNATTRPPGTASLPLLHILAAFPLALFTGALATDIAYSRTAVIMWSDFSAWLLLFAEAFGVAAGLVGVAVLIANRRLPRGRPIWPVVVGAISVLVIGFFDNLVHSRDAWTSVVPTGLTLSAINVLLILVVAWFGFAAATLPARRPHLVGAE